MYMYPRVLLFLRLIAKKIAKINTMYTDVLLYEQVTLASIKLNLAVWTINAGASVH